MMTLEDRIRLTADGVNQTYEASSDYAPLIFAFVDSLHLLQFEPCQIEVTSLGLRSIPAEHALRLGMPVESQVVDPHLGVTARCKSSVATLRLCCERLALDYPEAYAAISQGLKAGEWAFPSGNALSPAVALSAKRAAQLLRPFGERHARLMQSLEEAPWSSGKAATVFSAVRYSGSNPRIVNGIPVSYTAQILLTERQRAAALSLRPDLYLALENPLEQDSTAVVDTCFTTGFVDRGGLSEAGRDGRDAPASMRDHARYEVESALYATLFDMVPGAMRATFYVPVHVNGTPWLAFYSLFDGSDWNKAYWLYRAVVPRLAAGVRANARAAYWQVLEGVVREALSSPLDWSGRLRLINQGWQDASNVYPFPCPQLIEAGAKSGTQGNENAEVFFAGRFMRLVVKPTVVDWARAQVDFDSFTAKDVCDGTSTMLTEFLTDSLKQSQLLFGFLHETGNALTETGWQAALRALETDQRAHPEEALVAERRHDRVDEQRQQDDPQAPVAAEAVDPPQRGQQRHDKERESTDPVREQVRDTLRRMQRPQVLISALRAFARAGAHDLPDWIDPDVEKEMDAFVLPYTQSVEWIIDHTFRYLGSSDDVRIANASLAGIEEQGLRGSWALGRKVGEPEWPPVLYFPPIRKMQAGGEGDGAQGTWTIAALLSEPIRNAAKALLNEKHYGTESLLLAYHVECSKDAATITISNTIRSVPARKLSSVGNGLTNFVGTELGIGTISVPELSTVHDGQVATVHVRLHPQGLRAPKLTGPKE